MATLCDKAPGTLPRRERWRGTRQRTGGSATAGVDSGGASNTMRSTYGRWCVASSVLQQASGSRAGAVWLPGLAEGASDGDLRCGSPRTQAHTRLGPSCGVQACARPRRRARQLRVREAASGLGSQAEDDSGMPKSATMTSALRGRVLDGEKSAGRTAAEKFRRCYFGPSARFTANIPQCFHVCCS